MDLKQKVEDGRAHTEKELEEVKEMLRIFESEGEERRKEQEDRYDKKMENMREDIKTWTEVGSSQHLLACLFQGLLAQLTSDMVQKTEKLQKTVISKFD